MCLTVVELPEFIRRSERLLSDDERLELISLLAKKPSAGVLIKNTGGIRKIRWARKGSGKRGGLRVIYFFFNSSMRIFLLTVFKKADITDLTAQQKQVLKKLTVHLINTYRS